MKLYDAISFQLAEAFRAQQYSANYINSEAWYFQKDFSNEGISPVLSAVRIVKNNNEEIPEISGAAVFKQDKLVGYIDGNEAESLLFIRNKLKGGVISVKDVANTKADVSLEVIGNKTTITPQIEDGNITMYINIKIHVGITEMGGDKNFISEEGRAELKNAAKATIKKQIEELIEKTQNNFGSDVLGFGKRIQKKMPGTWKKLVLNWDEAFKTVKTSINVEVNIVSSSSSYKPITAGD
jgi:spore germination protein KC